jgi:hypothetical protein
MTDVRRSSISVIAAASVPVLDRLTCPVRFVLATRDSLGTKDGEMEQGRATLDPVLGGDPNLKVSAKVASNHSKILRQRLPRRRPGRTRDRGRCVSPRGSPS